MANAFTGNISIDGPNFTEPIALSTWKQVCSSSTGSLVVNGRVVYNHNDSHSFLGNTTLRFGLLNYNSIAQFKITQVNLFSPSLSVERMQNVTDREKNNVCKEPGNVLDWNSNIFSESGMSSMYKREPSAEWEKVNWTFHGKVKIKEMTKGDHICWPEVRNFDYFTKDMSKKAGDLYDPTQDDGWSFLDCMEHCNKLRTRYPSLRENYKELVSFSDNLYLSLWLPMRNDVESMHPKRSGNISTTGDVWRDYYTGEKVKITDVESGEADGNNSHCLQFVPKFPSVLTSTATCSQPDMIVPLCLCQNERQKPKHLFLLRGMCASSRLRTSNYRRGLFYALHSTQLEDRWWETVTAKQFFYVGGMSSRMFLDETSSQWILNETLTNTSAVSSARVETFAVGKHNWTIIGDHRRCQDEHHAENGEYRTELKLTGCKPGFAFEAKGSRYSWTTSHLEDGEFTCDDGQCVSMEKRCNKLHDCNDRSDEKGCSLITLSDGYDKNTAPFKMEHAIIPVTVNVTIRLLKMMGIDEPKNTIDLQFEIMLEWIDYRLDFNNLKEQTYLNALTEEDKKNIWLPIVVFDNTDQKETTRLGVEWEWTTSVTITREGNFTRHV